MADMDDLFKKRDKKKKPTATGSGGKTTSKFTKINPEEFAKKLELVNTLSSGGTADAESIEDSYVLVENANTINEQQSSAPATESLKTQQIISNIPAATTSTSSNKHEHNGDEEWKPFESDDHKDYSGLRVNILRTEGNEEDEENELSSEHDKKPNCPWTAKQNKQAAASLDDTNEEEQQSSPVTQRKDETTTQPKIETAASVTAAKKPESDTTTTNAAPTTTSAETSAPKTGSYVPPHLRNQAGGAASTTPAAAAPTSTASAGKYIPPSMRAQQSGSSQSGASSASFTTVTKNKSKANQPNINDAAEFPSLGDAPTGEAPKSSNDNKYEQPKRVAKGDNTTGKPNSIDLENRYGALSSTSS